MSAAGDLARCLAWGGTPSAQCSCGRFHFDSTGEYMEPGELEGLERRAQEAPGQYFSEPGSVRVCVHGATFVDGCQCGWLERAAEMLIKNRLIIAKFYRRRAEAFLRESEELSEAGNQSDERIATKEGGR